MGIAEGGAPGVAEANGTALKGCTDVGGRTGSTVGIDNGMAMAESCRLLHAAFLCGGWTGCNTGPVLLPTKDLALEAGGVGPSTDPGNAVVGADGRASEADLHGVALVSRYVRTKAEFAARLKFIARHA